MAGGLTSQVALLVEEHNSIADIVSTLLQALSVSILLCVILSSNGWHARKHIDYTLQIRL